MNFIHKVPLAPSKWLSSWIKSEEVRLLLVIQIQIQAMCKYLKYMIFGITCALDIFNKLSEKKPMNDLKKK